MIEESLDCLGRAKRCTQLDLTNAYHRMRIREDNKWRTAFRTWYDHFKYKSCLSAFPTLQGYVNKILTEKLGLNPDIHRRVSFTWMQYVGSLSTSKSMASSPTWRNVVSIRMRSNSLTTWSPHKECKCKVRIEVVKTRPELKSVRDIQVFIGLANIYRRFIRDFSRIAAPLTSTLKTTSSTFLHPLVSEHLLGVAGAGGNMERLFQCFWLWKIVQVQKHQFSKGKKHGRI